MRVSVRSDGPRCRLYRWEQQAHYPRGGPTWRAARLSEARKRAGDARSGGIELVRHGGR